MILTLVKLYGKYQYIPKETNMNVYENIHVTRNMFPFQNENEFENFRRQLYSKYKVKLSKNDVKLVSDRLGVYKTINFIDIINDALQILPSDYFWGNSIYLYTGGFIRSNKINKLNFYWKPGVTYERMINTIAKEYDIYYREKITKGSY